MTVDEQMQMLRRMQARNVPQRLGRGFLALTIALFGATAYTGDIGWFMVGMFFVAVTATVRQSASHIRRAAQALDAPDAREDVSVQIDVEEDSESATYWAIVQPGAARWKIDFVAQGWKPAAGLVEVEARYIDGTAWPVLLIAPQGIMLPRSTPKPL